MRGLLLIACVTLAACAPAPRKETTPPAKTTMRKPVRPKPPRPRVEEPPAPSSAPGTIVEGIATWYGGKHHGGPTASGERFDKRAMTAAHRTLPMGTRVRVTRIKNGRSVIVRINDRGPYGKDRRRIIDVSEAAARALDMIDDGIAKVTVEVLP